MTPRITLVGPHPPPLGGVSLHILRFGSLATSRYCVRVVDPIQGAVYSPDPAMQIQPHPTGRFSGRLGLMRLLRDPAPDVVHFHVSHLGRFLVAGHLAITGLRRGTRTILTLHTDTLIRESSRWSFARRALMRSLFRRFDRIVAVSEPLADFVRLGGLPKGRVVTVPAYLPSSPRKNAEVDHETQRLSLDGRRILLVSGPGTFDYGFHRLLDVLEGSPTLLASTAPVFCLYQEYDEAYLSHVLARLKRLPISAVFRDLDPDSFAYLLSRIDVFVRPTTTDGDSVALREAGALGKQIVASDAHFRPPGVLLYDSESATGFASALARAVDDPTAGRMRDDNEDYGARLLELYEDLLSLPSPA